MKAKSLLIFVLALTASASMAATDSKSPNVNVLKPATTSGAGEFGMIRIEPHWLILKQLQLDFQIRAGRNLSVGPSLGLRSYAEGLYYGSKVLTSSRWDYHTDSQAYGIRAAYNFNGFDKSGALISSTAAYIKSRVKADDLATTEPNQWAEFDQSMISLNGGYQWIAGPMAFNVGGGINYNEYPSSIEFKPDSGPTETFKLEQSKIGLSLDAGIGYQF